MRHIEVHVVTSVRESRQLQVVGLPPVHVEPIECGCCTRSLGLTGSIFEPVCVVLDPQSLAYLCTNCIKPLLKVLPEIDTRPPNW